MTPVVTEGTHQYVHSHRARRSVLPDAHAEHFPGPIHQPPLVANVDAIQPGVHLEHPVHPKLQHHFDDMEQQVEASVLGMWVFLVTEILFFGGLFLAYIVYRAAAPQAFQEASPHLNRLGRVQHGGPDLQLADDGAGRARGPDQPAGPNAGGLAAGTMFLGTVFLGVKVIEDADKFEHHIVPGPHFDKSAWAHPAGVEQFYSLYLIMTGLHACT